MREPHNLGPGWIASISGGVRAPVKDHQRCGNAGARRLRRRQDAFSRTGTGLGSALIVDGVIAAMELGHLHCADGRDYEDYLGERGRRRLGNRIWRDKVKDVVEGFRKALLPDYIVLGEVTLQT